MLMLMTIIILLAAAILVFALHRKRDVNFNMKVWGASMSLEAKGQNVRRAGTRSKGA